MMYVTCMCIYYFQSRHTVYISYCNIWISQLWQLWTLIYNHPNPSIFFATKNKKHTEISSNNFQVDIFLSNQKTVSKHHLLHLGIPYSAKSASAAFGTCFLGLSESVQPEINRWEDVWLWIFRGFFVALLPCFFFRIVSRDFKIYSHIFLKDVFHQWRNSCMNHCVFFLKWCFRPCVDGNFNGRIWKDLIILKRFWINTKRLTRNFIPPSTILFTKKNQR